MVIVKSRSDNVQRLRKEYCVLVYEKAGKYMYIHMIPTRSRKSCCKFGLNGKFIKKLGG